MLLKTPITHSGIAVRGSHIYFLFFILFVTVFTLRFSIPVSTKVSSFIFHNFLCSF